MEPIRTCVGCRQRANQADLLRVVSQNNVLNFDHDRAIAGRGAWLHCSEGCLELAISRRAFVRGLKLSGQPNATGLIFTKEQAETMLAKK